VEATKLRADFFKECTPGYYNNEGKPSMSAARNATYGHGSPAFLKILKDWRADGKLAGLDLKYTPKEDKAETARPSQAINGVQKIKEDTRNLAQKYTDLQAKHQAEMCDLLRKQKAEVVRLLSAPSG
jgi:cyclohexanone monooxygenase